MKRFIDWLLALLSDPAVDVGTRLKFPRGMEWTCPKCGGLIAVTRRDIFSNELLSSSSWRIEHPGFWAFRHCPDVRAFRGGVNRRSELHTPDGWVG